ncbi:MAG: DUF481 domain-containing protein [Planctomycetota bacterium]|jgi:hypothetical protein
MNTGFSGRNQNISRDISRLLIFVVLACSLVFGGQKPPEPGSDGFDWVQLKNGEWVKGQIEEMEDETLTIDSDILEKLEIDWDDIYAIYTAGVNTYVFIDGSSVLGKMEMVDETISVKQSDAQITEYPRQELMEIIEGGESELDFWSFRLSVGATYRRGNTDQTDIMSSIDVERRTPQLRTQLGYRGTYGDVDNQKTVDNQSASFKHDVFLDPQWYLTLPSIQYYRDEFQNIAHRVTPGLGVGYEIFERGDIEWNVGGGGGYQYTEFNTVEAGQDTTQAGGAIFAMTDLKWELTDTLDWNFAYNTNIGLASDLGVDHHVETGLSFDLWRDLDFDVTLTWDRIGSTERSSDGAEPDSDDIRLYFGVGWEM